MTNNNSDDKNLDDKNKVINFNDSFKLPIYYNENKISLNKNIINDLELVNTIDEHNKPILVPFQTTLTINLVAQLANN